MTTNWYVITGGPSSGKTTSVNILNSRGYTTTIEHARHLIDLQRVTGHTAEETRSNQAEFQNKVLQMQMMQEAELDPEELVFLDRAIPDSLAYYRFTGLEPTSELAIALTTVSYKKIFIMDLLPLAPDYARTEHVEDQIRIDTLLREVYSELPFPVVRVPVLEPELRVDFILENL